MRLEVRSRISVVRSLVLRVVGVRCLRVLSRSREPVSFFLFLSLSLSPRPSCLVLSLFKYCTVLNVMLTVYIDSPNDPGLLINIYYPVPTSYTAPGPSVFTC